VGNEWGGQRCQSQRLSLSLSLVLGFARLGIDQQQIQVAAHAGVAAAVAAENAHPLQAWVLHRHPFGPAGNLVKHMLRLMPAQ
jgi:hypothetical protein